MSLLGLDISTTACKSVIFDEEGKILSAAYKEYEEIYPRPGWVEMDPNKIWSSIKEVISVSASRSGKDRVEAICFSVLGVAVTPINRKGEPLYNSLTAVDGRTIKEAAYLEEKLGKEKIFEETGSVISPAWSITKIMWLKENEPEIFRDAWKFVLYEDFVINRFGLGPKISHSLAGLTMAFNSKEKKWSEAILESSGIDKDLLSEPVRSGQVLGSISPSVAEELGLTPDTKIISGGFDQAMSALGGGLAQDGMSTICFGTIDCVTTAFSKLENERVLLEHNHPIYCHAVDDLYISIGWCFTAGALLKWYRDVIAKDIIETAKKEDKDVFDLMLSEAEDRPSRILVLPHFIGSGTPYLDSRSLGAFIGMDLSSGRGDITKAILDSLAYENRINIETIEEAGTKIDSLNLFGGGAKSDLLAQTKSDILQREIRALSISESGCLGAALLAGYATGIYKDLGSELKNIIKPRKVFHPRKEDYDTYNNIYSIYERLYPALKDINHALSDLG